MGKIAHHRLAPSLTGLPLYNQAPNIPIEGNQLRVDRLERFILCGADTLFDLTEQGCVVGWQISCHFLGIPPSSPAPAG